MKKLLPILLLAFSCDALAEWVEYATRANGDVHFYDDARVEKDAQLVEVWNRVRYKTSVMGASSYESLLRIDCAERSETTLQSTFFSDRDWSNPAMATDTMEKPKMSIDANSATRRLADMLCD